MSFKVGDRVKIRKDSGYYHTVRYHKKNPPETTGTIINIYDRKKWSIEVQWPAGENQYYEMDLEYSYELCNKYIKRHEF